LLVAASNTKVIQFAAAFFVSSFMLTRTSYRSFQPADQLPGDWSRLVFCLRRQRQAPVKL